MNGGKPETFEEWEARMQAATPSLTDVLRLLHAKCTLEWIGMGDAVLKPIHPGAADPTPVTAELLQGMLRAGMIERQDRHPLGRRYYQWQLSDIGLGILGLPTYAEQKQLERNGELVKVQRRGRK